MAGFERYRSFVAVYRAGTVSRAAEARFLTQPAVSQHVAALEGEMGRRLFKRTPRRMVPTGSGKNLYSRVAQAVDALERVAQEGRRGAPGEEVPVVRLGAPSEFFHEVLLPGLAGAPLRFWLRFGETGGLIGDLERGELDLVVATQRLPSQAVEYEKLADEHFLPVGGPDHKPVDGSGEANPATVETRLKELPWISYGTELPIIRRFWQQSFGRRPNIQPTLVLPDLRTVLKAVVLGQGVTVLPDCLCRDALRTGGATLLWRPPEPVENSLWTAYRKVDRTDNDLRQARLLLNSSANTGSP